MSEAVSIIHHLTPAAWYADGDPGAPYLPEAFDADGFIHCTDGLENVVATANRHCRADPRPYLLLRIDTRRVTAVIRYEDPAHIYPHIYGPLDRAAIIDATPMPRAEDGTFLPLPHLPA